MAVGFGEPLRIHELNIEGLVDEFTKRGLTTTTSKIQGLHPAQKEICNDEARFKVLACGRRFGKSLFVTLIAMAVALQPGRKIWIVGDSYEVTDRVFLELYHLLVNELKLAVASKGGGASKLHRYINLPNGSVIQGKTCENRNSLVGEAIDLLIWDECSLVANGKDIWNQELRATLADREGSAIFISTPRGRNHFYEFFVLGKDGMELRRQKAEGKPLNELEEVNTLWSGFQFSSYCNTIDKGGFLKRSEFDSMRLSMPDVKFRQEVMADFTAVADSAFPEFKQDIQVCDYNFNPSFPVYVGMDFNYQTPCTTLYVQMDPNNNILIFDEFHPMDAHNTVHQQAKQLLEMDAQLGQKIEMVAADISGAQKGLNGRSAWDDLADWGIYPVGRKQKIETGCDLIRLWCAYPKVAEDGSILFKEDGTADILPKLFINKRCKRLIFSLEAARAPEAQTGVSKEGYKKDGITDGPLDALRYILVYLLHGTTQAGLVPAGF
jgi:hypothetical protein